MVAFESYPKDARDLSPQLTLIKAANPDVLFLPNYYYEVPLQVQQARRLGITCPFIGSDSWGSPEILTLCGVDLDQSYFSTHYAPDIATDIAQKFIREYAAKYGKKPDDVAALTYDAGGLLLQAIRQAGAPDPQKVRDALASVQEFDGVTGNMKFHGTGDPIKSAVIIHVKDCKFKYYATVNP